VSVISVIEVGLRRGEEKRGGAVYYPQRALLAAAVEVETVSATSVYDVFWCVAEWCSASALDSIRNVLC